MVSKQKKYEGKATAFLAFDPELWKEFKPYREPYGTLNEMFEDFIRILLGKPPEHPEILRRIREVVQSLPSE